MYALAIHGGAGSLPREQMSSQRSQAYRDGLTRALSIGQRTLERGSALDAVQAAVCALEDDPLFNAGRGAVLTSAGTVELDAAIMDGRDLRAGAVAQLQQVRNPVNLARALLERSEPVFLVGAGAEAFARAQGIGLVAPDYFITAPRRQQLQRQQQAVAAAPGSAALEEPPFGTVGAVALDREGHLAAATSTGGTPGKHPGRVGDSPVIGAGVYADDHSCAVSTTGHGEWFLRLVAAYDIAARMYYGGQSLSQAADESVIRRMPALGAAGGLIALDRAGNIVMRFNSALMFRASIRSGESAQIDIY